MPHTLFRSSNSDLAYSRSYSPNHGGTANWMTAHEVEYDKALTDKSGLFQGFIQAPGSRRSISIAIANALSIYVSPIGGGKDTCINIPNCLSYPGSLFVLDVKGEAYAITNEFRRTLGKVIRFAPWSSKQCERINPLDSVRTPNKGGNHEFAEEDVVDLVKLLVVSENEKDPYWNNAARTVLEAIVLYVVTTELTDVRNGHIPTERTMAEVVRLLSLPPTFFVKTLDEMDKSEFRFVRDRTGIIRQTMKSSEQFAGVIGNLMEHIKPWGIASIAKATAHSDFKWSELRKPGTSFYLCVPPDKIAGYSQVMRTIIGCAIKEVKDSEDKSHRVTFLLNEFPTLKRMTPIEDSFAYLRGYGINLSMFLQDLSQLERCYPDSWRSFLANASCLSFFGINDLHTAQMLSDLLGHTTVSTYSFSEQIGRSQATGNSNTNTTGDNISSSSSTSSYTDTLSATAGRTVSFTSRKLLMPDEIRTMHPREQIIIVRGKKPIRAALLPYYEHKILSARAGEWDGSDKG